MTIQTGIVDGATLLSASKQYKAIFYSELEKQASALQPLVDLLAMDVPSTDLSIQMDFLLELMKMEEWIDERVFKKLAAATKTITMKDYQAGLVVKRNDIRYDKTGIVKPRIMQLANSSARMPYDHLVAQLNLAFTAGSLSYDGVVFCDPSEGHASGSNWTADLFDIDAFHDARLAMVSQVDANSQKLDVSPTHIFYASSLRKGVVEAFGPKTVSTGGQNMWENELVTVELAGLTTGYWFLMDLSKSLKPFVWMHWPDGNGNFVALDRPDDHSAFEKKEFKYGVDRTGYMGYALHELCHGSDASGS